MPIYSIQAPNGRTYEIEGPAGATQDDVIQQVLSQHPEAAAPAQPKPGFVPALKAGISNIKGDIAALAGRAGIMSLPAAEQYRAEREAEAKATFAPTQQGWTEAPLTKIGELAGGSLPYMVAPVAAGGAAALGGAPALAATGLAGLTSAAQFTGSNLSRQVQEGKKLGETDLGAAAAASVPQAALDMVGFKMMPGIRQIFKAAGKELAPEAAKKIAEQSISQIARDYALSTGKTMGVEGLTEAGQQVFERLQAGLKLTDPQARQEYFDNFVGGAVLGGVMAPAGRYHERGRERDQQRLVDEQARAQAAQESQQQEAQQEQVRQAQYQDPAYAQQVAQEYQEAEARALQLRAATKVGKDAPMADKLAAKEAGAALRDFIENELKPKAAEYNKVKPLLAQVEQQAPTAQPQTEEAAPGAQADMFPGAPMPTEPQKSLFGTEMRNQQPIQLPSAEDGVAQHADMQRKLTALENTLEEQRGKAAAAAQAGDLDAAAAESDKFRQLEQAFKDMQAQQKQLPPAPKALPTGENLENQYSRALKALAVAGENGDVDAIQRAVRRVKLLQQQNPDLFTKRHEQAIRADEAQLGEEMATGREQAAQQRVGVEQEVAGIRGLGQQEPGYTEQARKERQNQLEVEGMERGRMDTARTEQGVLFPEDTGAGVKQAAQNREAVRQGLVAQLQDALRRRKDDPQQYRPVVGDLLERIRALKEAPAPGTMPRGGQTAELAPELAGTRMPGQLPAGAEGVSTERQLMPTNASEKALQTAVAQLPSAAQSNPVLQQAVANLGALRNAKALPDVANLVHRLRAGLSTEAAEADLKKRLDLLEEGARAAEPAQADMFPNTELQGTIFNTAEEFQQYLASEGLHTTRKAVGLALQTLSRAKQRVAPLQARAAELRESVANLNMLLNATLRTGAEKIDTARAAHQKALARMREHEKAVDDVLRPAQAAVIEAELQLSKAQAARAKVLDSIAKNTAKFSPDEKVKAAADAAAAAQHRYKDALAHGSNSQEYIDEVAAEAKKAEAAHRAALKRATNPLDRSVEAYLQKDMELQLRLADAEQTLASARTQLDGAKAALEEVYKATKGGLLNEAEERVNKRAEAQTRGVVTRVTGAHQRTVEKQTAELAQLNSRLQRVEKAVDNTIVPLETAADRRTVRAAPAAETQAQGEARAAEQRRVENERLSRLAAIPGQRVSHEEFRASLERLTTKMPERIRELDAKAKDETTSEAARNKAKYEARKLRAETAMLIDMWSSDPERVRNARETLENEIVALQQKLQEKQAGLNEPGKSKSTLASRRKEASEMRSKLRELVRVQKQLSGRAKVTPIGTPEERAQQAYEREAQTRMEQGIALETEGTTGRLPPRVIGPVVRKIGPGQGKVRQAGKPRGVTPTQAVRAAQADTTHERAMLEMSRIEDLQEKSEAALEAAQTAGDKEKVAKYRDFLKRLDIAHVKAEAAMEAAMSKTRPQLAMSEEDLSAPSVQREVAERRSTDLPQEVADAVRDGRTVAAVKLLADQGSTPQVRAIAAKLQPLLARTKLIVDEKVQYQGQSVAGLYDPVTNTVTVHPDALTEEDLLHELTHAATDTVLLTPAEKLKPSQLAARTELENLRRTIEKHPNFKGEQIGNVREFAAEAFSNPEFQAKLEALGKPTSLWARFVNMVRRLLGFDTVPPGTRVNQLINRILKPSREMTGPATPAPSVQRSAAEELAGDIIAQPQGFKERFSKNLGLSAEMWGVDMRAPLVKALGAAGERAARQASYLVRKADARMSHTYAALSAGPLQVKKDSKGFMTIEAGNGPSAKKIFEAVSRIPGSDAKAKMEMAQVYLTAKRAERVGWDKLDFDPSRVPMLQQKATAMMREVNADPATKDALEEVSSLYNDYNKGLIGFLAQSGAISKAKAAELLKHGDYVPFYRVLGNGTAELVLGEGNVYNVGNIRTQPYLKELKGGDQRLLPLNEALIRNTMVLTDMGMRNLATKDVAYALQTIGKDAGVMRIQKGDGGASPNVVRFKQEPDPSDPRDDGSRHLVVDTAGTAVDGIPADMLAQSMEGSFAVLPSFLKVAGWFGDVLRSGVTRNPMYVARQLFRDPMAASFTAGLDAGPLTATARSVKEFADQMAERSATAEALLKKGVVHSNIFTGDVDDMAKFSLQLAKGDQSAYQKLISFWDAAAMRADAATRAQMYDSAIKQGMSEMEAELAAMEMMNFNKRGISPTVQFASRMIPFFNAQIQGLNVLYKAATGQMPMADRLKIKEKFYRRALTLAAFTLLYAAAMDDDDTYKNARPRDRYGNFFLPNPLGGEHLKVPIPFEVGVLFKAIPEAMLDAMKGKATQQEWAAIKQLLINQIPGSSSYGIPQIARPALEVMSNSNWYTGREIETAVDKRLLPQERFGRNTSEFAKRASEALAAQPVEALQMSPKQIEHLLNGYLGSLPIAVARMTNSVFSSEETNPVTPEMRGSDLPVFGSLFQREHGGGPVDAAYAQAQALEQAANTFQKMVNEGRVAQAMAFRENAVNVVASPQLAKTYTTRMTAFNKADAAIRRTEKDPQRMRTRLDELDKQRTEFAKLYLQAVQSLAK